MASTTVGLKASARDIELMLNMSGGYRKPQEAADKLDLLESISGKVMENIEKGQKMKLSMDYFARFLKREGMTPGSDAKVLVSQLNELISRERRRLGKMNDEKGDMLKKIKLLEQDADLLKRLFSDETPGDSAPTATVEPALEPAGGGGASKRAISSAVPTEELAPTKTTTAAGPAEETPAAKRARTHASGDNPPANDAPAAADGRAGGGGAALLEQLMQLVPLALEDVDTSEQAKADLQAKALEEITRILQASEQGLEILKGSTTDEKRNDLVRIACLLLPKKNLVPSERRGDADSALMLALESYLPLSK
jgi:hypothetical protein